MLKTIKINLLLCCAILFSPISFGAAVSTFNLDTLDVVIAKVTTLGLGNELTFYNVNLHYNANTLFWELTGGLSETPAQNQGEARPSQYDAFTGSIVVPEICDTTSQSLCFAVTFKTEGFAGSGIFSLYWDGVRAVNPTHPVGGWSGSAIDTQCGGGLPYFALGSNSEGLMSGTAVDTEGTEYIVVGSLSDSGMSLSATDGFGDITLSCPLDVTGSKCSGAWTGVWAAESLTCGGTFQLTRQ